MRPAKLALVPVLSLLAAACGGDKPDSLHSSTRDDTVPAACTDSSLDGPVCSGPWKYRTYNVCYADKPSWDCAGSQHKDCYWYDQCSNPAFGIAYYTDQATTVTVAGDIDTQCSGRPVRCHNVCDFTNSDPNPAAAAAQSALGGWSYTLGACSQSSGPPRCRETCQVTVHGVPVYNSRAAPPCPSHWYECGTELSCRTASNGNDPDPTACGYDPAFQLSPVGLTLDQLAAGKTPFVEPPICTTCEPTSGTEAKDQCLSTSLSGDASYRARVVRNLKLLLELHAAELSDAERAAIVDLFRTDPTSEETACGPDWAPPASDGSCGDLSGLNAKLVACNRLLLPHVPRTSVGAMLPLCLGTGAVIDALDGSNAGCHQSDYAAAYHTLSIGLGKRLVTEPAQPSYPPAAAALHTRLAGLGAWYDLAKGRYAAGADRTPLYKDTTELVGDFWSDLRAAAMSPLEGADRPDAAPVGAAQLADTRLRTLELDRQVVLALFSDPTPPMNDGAMLFVLGDSLQALSERGHDLAEFHDLGCQFRTTSCAGQADKITSLMTVLGSLDAADALGAALSAATPLAGDPWATAFGAIQSKHAALEQAVLDVTGAATYTPDLLTLAQAPSAPPPLPPVAAIIRAARADATTFAKTGLFDPTLRRQLSSGIQEQNEHDIETNFQTQTSALETTLTNYRTNISTLIQNLVADLHNAGEQKTIDDQVKLRIARNAQLEDEEQGLRQSAALADERFGKFMDAFQATVSSGQVDQNLQVNRQTAAIDVSSRQAKYQPGHLNILRYDLLAVQRPDATTWSMEAQPGDLVQLNITGQWSPTCAMQKFEPPANLRNRKATNDPDFSTIDVSNALTGPEGFTITVDNTHLTAKGYTGGKAYNNTDSQQNTFNLCGGLSESLGVSGNYYGISASVMGSASQTWCHNESNGMTQTEHTDYYDIDNTEQRSVVALTGAVRMDKTPFRKLPAGALLLAEMPHGTTTGPFVVHVLSRQSAVVINHHSDLYLIVNDLSDPTCTYTGDDTGLTVQLAKSTPLGTQIQQVGTAMSAAVTALAGETDRLVGQGEMLPSDQTSLHDIAWMQLHTGCNCDPTQLPPVLTGLFNVFVDEQIGRIERQVKIASIVKQSELTLLELQSYADDLARSQGEGRLVQLLPAWALRNLDGEQLRVNVTALARLMSEQIYPIVHLRYPSVITQLAGDSQTQIDALRTADWSTPLADLADTAYALAQNLERDLSTTISNTRHPEPVMLALRFPKPGVTPSSAPFRIADAARSLAVWNSLAGDGQLSFTLTPDDVYQAGGGARVLACTDTVPVIRSMALYGVLTGAPAGTDTTLNAWDYRVGMSAADELTFTSTSGPDTYSIAPDWRANPVHLLFGNIVQASSTDIQNRITAPQTANGLSPFTTFDVDVSQVLPPNNPAGSPFTYVTELMLLFQVEVGTTANPGLTWIDTCRQ